MGTTTLKIPSLLIHTKPQSESMLMQCMAFMLDMCHIFSVHKGLGFLSLSYILLKSLFASVYTD